MRNTSAALVTAAMGVGIARLAQAHLHRRQQQQNMIATAQMHQEWLEHMAPTPSVRDLWASEGTTGDEYGELMEANRIITTLWLRFRLGVIDSACLRLQARWVMEREVGRRYWAAFGSFREDEAKGRADRRFNAVMTDEYTARPEVTTAAA